MANDAQEIIGVWTVKYRHWVWEYTFTPDGNVVWYDPYNGMKGSGRWGLSPSVVWFTWNGSTTKESWKRPIRPESQQGWIDASYGVGASTAQKKGVKKDDPSAPYTGEEAPVDLPATSPPEDSLFYLPQTEIKSPSHPIYDIETGGVIGFVYRNNGYHEFYDVTGKRVATDELPLEEPLLDPIDFVVIVGGIARGLGKAALSLGIRAAASAGSKAVVRSLTSAIIGGMRSVFRSLLSAKTLKFTGTTAQRMGMSGRYVPMHILKMAIRHGVREPHPRGVKGAFQYTLKIIRSEKNIAPGVNPAASWGGKTYTLKVVVKEELKSNTILHFHYQ